MNVTIRPLIEKDAYMSVKWRNDSEVFKYTGHTYNNEITIDSELEWIKRVMQNCNEYRCAILVNNIYVGNIYLTDITNESAFYHIFIGDKRYWGKGVAYHASKLILDYAFKKLLLSKVYLNVKTENLKAIKLYNRLGFKKVDSHGEFNLMLINNEGYIKTISSY